MFTKLYRGAAFTSPTSTVAVTPTANGEMSGLGISFILPPGLGNGTENEIVPETSEFMVWPDHRKLTLTNYPVQGTTFQPQILVFPVKEFAQMGKCPKSEINGLKHILTTQEMLLTQPLPCTSIADSLPFLPDEHARQVFHAQEKFLSFRNGTGIRYVTQYSQAAFPYINNSDLFYTFQGLTKDGKYYVSLLLPLNFPGLAADYGPESFNNPADWQNPEKFPDYLRTMVDTLNQGTNSFTPSLESLDTFAQSLLVGDFSFAKIE
jgi:hypothetical protein